MSFIDSVSKFTSGVAEKTKGNVDVFSLNQQISTLEKEITEVYKQLGIAYYNANKENPEGDLGEFVKTINEKFASIEEVKAEIEKKKAEIAAVQLTSSNEETAAPAQQPATGKVCPNCGNPVSDELFCGKCGTKLEQVVEKVEEPETTEPAEDTRKFCKECGTELEEGALFCSTCGTKVE